VLKQKHTTLDNNFVVFGLNQPELETRYTTLEASILIITPPMQFGKG
jgi:hypothetical protein